MKKTNDKTFLGSNGIVISGIPNIDNKYLNPIHKRVNDKFGKHLNYYIVDFIRTKNYQVGFLGFLAFIKTFLSLENFQDYFNRFENFNLLDLSNSLNETFKDKQVFKINLSDIELEKLNKKYLFYSNDLKLNDYKVTFLYLDEFLFNVRMKPNYTLFKQLNDFNKFYSQDYLNKSILKDLIIIVEKLDYDRKHTFIYCNKRTYNTLLQTIKDNNIQWYKTSQDKLLKLIKKYSYTFNDFEEQYETLLKDLKHKKRTYNKLDKKASFYKKELELLLKSNKSNTKRFNTCNIRLNQVLSDLNNLELDLIDINQDLLDFEKSQDKFLNNLLDEKTNYSFKLKSYL